MFSKLSFFLLAGTAYDIDYHSVIGVSKIVLINLKCVVVISSCSLEVDEELTLTCLS